MSGPGDGRRKAERRREREPIGRRKRSYARQAARMMASTNRISKTRPNCVSFTTVDSTSVVTASLNGRPLIAAASSSSQIAADAAVMARPIHATRRICVRTAVRHGFGRLQSGVSHHGPEQEGSGCQRRGSEMHRANGDQWVDHTVPGHAIGLPALLPDLKGEAALGRVGVDRQHLPSNPVGSRG